MKVIKKADLMKYKNKGYSIVRRIDKSLGPFGMGWWAVLDKGVCIARTKLVDLKRA